MYKSYWAFYYLASCCFILNRGSQFLYLIHELYGLFVEAKLIAVSGQIIEGYLQCHRQ